MSYILDALKKSEYERNLGRNLAPGDGVPGVAAPRPLWPRVVGLLLALNLIGIALMVWWPEDESVSVDVAAPAADATNAPAAASPAAVAIESAPAPAASAAVMPAASLAESIPPAARRAAPPPKTPPARLDDAPPLRLLPVEFQSSLPPLQVNIHVYGEDAAARLLYINDRQARVGEFVGEGVRVEAIVPDGAVLSYRGRVFKLPRPN